MKRFTRRPYERTAMVAARKRRVLGLFWARRCHKTTTIGAMAFDDISKEDGRTAIAASASLLLGSEIVGMTLGAAEQAAIVANEAAAMNAVFQRDAAARDLDVKCANQDTGKVYAGLSAEDFAELYKASKLELRLYFSNTRYSRLRIIAPQPATARGWGGTVYRDECGYTPVQLENDLRVATKPIIDTDPSFRIIYAANLPRDDRHPWFEDTLPPSESDLEINGNGNFYIGQTGMLIHRVTLADAYAAGHVLYDDEGQPLSYADFIARPENKLGLKINYTLEHETGGTAAIDLLALINAQARGAGNCSFFFIDSDSEFRRAIDALRANVRDGAVGVGFDIATTTKGTSNPSSVTVTERNGTERSQRLVLMWKEKKPQVVRERLQTIFRTIASRPHGGRAKRFCILATSERYFAEETADELLGLVPTELVIESVALQPPGYTEKTNFKTFLGDVYAAAVNDNHYAMPPSDYFKRDQRMVIKNAGRYECDPEPDGKHGDTFSSGEAAEYALGKSWGAITDTSTIRVGGRTVNSRGVARTFTPRLVNAPPSTISDKGYLSPEEVARS